MVCRQTFSAMNIVGESILWDDNQKRLLWIDIVGKAIHAFSPSTKMHEKWVAPDFVTSISLTQEGYAMVAFTKRVCSWHYDDNYRTIAVIEEDLPNNRLNEGVVAPDGTLWLGTMQNNLMPDGSPQDITTHSGKIYRLSGDDLVERVSDDTFGITNTFVWTDDGSFITADTLKNEVYRYSVDPETKKISHRQTIISGYERGLPDGSTIDAEGYIWNCRVAGGGCLIRFRPDGHIDRVVDLPCSWPTSCTFGGENLDTLYITSARFTMDSSYLAKNPQEGGLFELKPDVKGTLSNRFKRKNAQQT